MGASGDVTGLLYAWASGDEEARDRVLALLYSELRRRAAAQLRRERAGHSLQPTALVHEAYVRLAGQAGASWRNRAHFLALASRMMRRVLVDHARARKASKRPGGWVQVSLDAAAGVATVAPAIDVLALDIALDRLNASDPRKAHIAEMKFFGGLTLREMGALLDVSPKTVHRDWQAARAWLFRELSERPESAR